MSKFRVVRVEDGFDPHFEVEKKLFGFYWWPVHCPQVSESGKYKIEVLKFESLEKAKAFVLSQNPTREVCSL